MSIKEFGLEETVSLIYCMLFLAAEILCTYSNIKCFSIPDLRSEPYIIILYINFHLTLILTFIIQFINLGFVDNNKLKAILGYLVILPKDILIITFTWEILRFVIIWNDEEQLPKIIKVVVQVTLVIHVLIFSFMVIYKYNEIVDTFVDCKPIIVYLSVMVAFITVLYTYSFIKAIKSWRNSGGESGRSIQDHLRWLFIIMLYMALTLVLRIILNTGQTFNAQNQLRELSLIVYVLYMMFNYVGCNLLPCVIMSIFFYKMAKDYDSDQNVRNSSFDISLTN
jgi:hypothetical protein